MYEIRFVASVNTSGHYVKSAKWPKKHVLNAGTAIKFHQNPSKIECHGLISRLNFNSWGHNPRQ